MSAMPSLLQLDTYYLKEVNYFLKDNLENKPDKTDTEIESIGLEISDVTTPYPKVENGWRCELVIKSADDETGSNPFYSFKIVMVGFFRISDSLSPEVATRLAESNCPAVLYSTSREIVATVTRRSPYPAILLPLVTFVKKETTEDKPKKRSSKKSKNT